MAVPILPMHGAGIIPAFLTNFGQAAEQVLGLAILAAERRYWSLAILFQ